MCRSVEVMRRWPVVPLMGDVQVTPMALLRVLRGVRGSKAGLCTLEYS